MRRERRRVVGEREEGTADHWVNKSLKIVAECVR